MEIRKVLFPTDFSATSVSALETAVEFSERFGAQLHPLYVLEDLPNVPVISFEHLPSATPEEFYQVTEKLARERLEKLLLERVPGPVRGSVGLRRGHPSLEIVLAAETENFDLIVMSTHGRTGLKHALLGSVTEKVVRKAPCPVLTVRASEEER
ncbi:MAG: universal stress protein [Planctomycetota bacterium]